MIDLVKNEVDELLDHIIDLRRYFHQHPEVSKNEYNTASKIEEELKNIGLTPIRVGETGVYAEIVGKNTGRILALRADIDALPISEETDLEFKSVNPGVMHACGHDIHTASLLGAARILYKNKDKINGSIKLIFQQAEEIGFGAKVFIEQGYMNNVDNVFGVHIASNLKVGTVACVNGANNASVDYFKIHIKGKSSHIATPEEGVDALYIASLFVASMKKFSKTKDKGYLVGIGKMEAGTAYNIIASDAYIEGTLRCFSKEIREYFKESITLMIDQTVKEFNATGDIVWKDFTSPLINEQFSTFDAQRVAVDLFGHDNVITEREPSLSGDDFAELLLQAPGTYTYIGTHNDNENTKLPHHNEKLIVDEDSLRTATSMYVGYTLKYLGN